MMISVLSASMFVIASARRNFGPSGHASASYDKSYLSTVNARYTFAIVVVGRFWKCLGVQVKMAHITRLVDVSWPDTFAAISTMPQCPFNIE